MSMRLFEYKQERAAALGAMDSLIQRAEADGNRSLTPEEAALFKAHTAEVDRLDKSIEPIEARNTFTPAAMMLGGGSGASAPAANLAPRLATTLQAAMQNATQGDRAEIKAFAEYVGGNMSAVADLRPSGDGGVFIPSLVASVVQRNYASFTPVRSVATIWPTQGGEPTTFPVISDSETAVILASGSLTGADATVSGNTPPTAITGPQMHAYKFSSKPILVPRETVTDASLNIIEEMLSALLARISRTQNLKYTKGTGTGEPTGFLTDATPYAAGAVALDLDVALDLAYSVPALYRPDGCYMASDTTVKYLRKLKTGLSGDKRALWKDAFEEGSATLGTPARLHGYDLIINNDLDSVAADGTFAGASPLVFGSFKKVIIREAENGSPFIYRYSVPASDGAAVIAFSRSDSKLVVPTAISKLVVS